MGFLDKVKNMFIEEVEDEEIENEEKVKEEKPVKTEVTHVTIASPVSKDKDDNMSLEDIDQINKFSDKIENERKEKNKRPIFFTDHDFEDFESYAPRFSEKKSAASPKKQTLYRDVTTTTDKKFKPTPIISPVYGILDKNYHKEDIISKQDPDYKSSDGLTVDSVRNKAFGNLEEELENTLYNRKLKDDFSEISEETTNDLADEEMLSEIEKNEVLEQEKKINNLKSISDSLDKELEDLVEKKEEMTKKKNQEVDDTDIDDDLDDDDLFNLIDSMYEERND